MSAATAALLSALSSRHAPYASGGLLIVSHAYSYSYSTSNNWQMPGIAFLFGVVAFCWLFGRAQNVTTQPVSKLVNLLGLEIPPIPEPYLLDICAESAAIQWKSAEQRSSVASYAIKIEGIIVGEVSNQDTSTYISGLLPDHFYTIRVIAINPAGFRISSVPIRIKTASGSQGDLLTNKHECSPGGKCQHGTPILLQYKASEERLLSQHAAQSMSREPSTGYSQSRRNGSIRRPSPASGADRQGTNHAAVHPFGDHEETMMELNERLETCRQEIEDEDLDQREDEIEHEKKLSELAEEREQLRQHLKAKDDMSKDLRKEVASLERANTAAQSKRVAYERNLQQKLAEEEKAGVDIARWDTEVIAMEAEAHMLVQQRHAHVKHAEDKITFLRSERVVDCQAIKELEVQVHEQGLLVKELERTQGSPTHGDATPERPKREYDEDKQWEEAYSHLQQTLRAAWNEWNLARHLYLETLQRTEYANGHRDSHASYHSGYATDEQLMTEETMMHRFQKYRNPTSSPNVSFVLPDPRAQSGVLHTHNESQLPSLATPSSSPLYSSNNFVASSSHFLHKDDALEADYDSLTNTSLISPTADALLPRDLLGDDGDDMVSADATNNQIGFNQTHTSRPLSLRPQPSRDKIEQCLSTEPEALPGLGAVPGPEHATSSGPGPISPTSINSYSPSALSSRRTSLTNFHQQLFSDGYLESDGRSVRSASSSSRFIRSGRFENLFNRQRGKTSSDEGPAFGSLSAQKSQSMPRQLEDGTKSDGTVDKKAGGLWSLGRRSKSNEQRDNAVASQMTGRSFNLLDAQNSVWSRLTVAERPVSMLSTYSAENALPRPSVDHQPFGWSSNADEGGLLGMHSAGSSAWSLYASRRQSISSHHQLPGIDQVEEDERELEADRPPSPALALIGTKSAKSKLSQGIQLNPNAIDFRSVFSRDKSRSEKIEKAKKKDKKGKGPATEEAVTYTDDGTTLDLRRSKEMQPSIVGDGIDESGNDNSAVTLQESGPSTVGSLGKESFMRRITRQRSALGSLKDKGSIFSRKTVHLEENEQDHTDNSTLLEKGAELEKNKGSSGGAASTGDKRSSFLSFTKKKGKKGADNAPSISETSMTSETGDDEDGSRPSDDA